MMDNVLDRTVYPLEQQKQEALNKRRMGLGITGLANAMEFLGIRYGSDEAKEFTREVMTLIRDECYKASVELAKEKGPFPLYEERYLEGEFIKTLPAEIQKQIGEHGIRNSHLLSIAPTGTISLWAGNISSGIEPVFSHEYDRVVIMPGSSLTRQTFKIQDYAFANWGLECPTSDQISAKEHIDILCEASKLVDSACSKTCNVGDEVTFDEFKELYVMAYEGGASGCTTFRPAGFREGVLKKSEPTSTVSGPTCEIDPTTGERSCAD
jgi:ribonucleoside-diphosphate reductase alpha chain